MMYPIVNLVVQHLKAHDLVPCSECYKPPKLRTYIRHSYALSIFSLRFSQSTTAKLARYCPSIFYHLRHILPINFAVKTGS